MCLSLGMAGAESLNWRGSRVRKNAGVHETTRIHGNAATAWTSFRSAPATLMFMIPVESTRRF